MMTTLSRARAALEPGASLRMGGRAEAEGLFPAVAWARRWAS